MSERYEDQLDRLDEAAFARELGLARGAADRGEDGASARLVAAELEQRRRHGRDLSFW